MSKRFCASAAIVAAAACGLLAANALALPAGKLPQRLTTPSGNFVTLSSHDASTSKHHLASADVSICTSAHTPKNTEAYPPFFTLGLANGSSLHISKTAAVSPALRITSLGPKQCARGWISFAVPAGAHLTALVYTYGPSIRWKPG